MKPICVSSSIIRPVSAVAFSDAMMHIAKEVSKQMPHDQVSGSMTTAVHFQWKCLNGNCYVEFSSESHLDSDVPMVITIDGSNISESQLPNSD